MAVNELKSAGWSPESQPYHQRRVACPNFTILSLTISRCQSNANRCKIRLNCHKLCDNRTQDIGSISGQWIQAGSEAELWSTDRLACMMSPKNLSHLVWMMLVSWCCSVRQQTFSLEMPAHQGTQRYNTSITDQTHWGSSWIAAWEPCFSSIKDNWWNENLTMS